MYCGMPPPASMRSLIFACAISRATTMGPVSMTRVFTGYCDNFLRMSLMGCVRSICTTSLASWSSVISGKKRAGSVSSSSRKMPLAVILPTACRSALHETANATGQLAPWRGRRTTRTSWQKYLPPNCAPIPVCWASFNTFCSSSTSRNAWPSALPAVGSESR